MYSELHCHSNYSFQEGASSVEDWLVRARDLGYRALALTDHDNLCGAMHFAQAAKTLDIQAITGVEMTIKDGGDGKDGKDRSHLTFLAENQEGYSQLSNLISYSYIAGDRRNPALDLKYLPDRVHGLLLLTGCRTGRVPSLLSEGRYSEAETQLRQYLDWFGTDNVFPSADHIPFLEHTFQSEHFSECRAKVPYLPFMRVPYYCYIGRRK